MSVDLLALQSMIDERIRSSSVSINVRQLQGQARVSGAVTVTITNGVDGSAVVAHGFRGTPSWASATASAIPSVRDDFFASIAALDASSVTVNVRASAASVTPVANPTDVTVYWEVG